MASIKEILQASHGSLQKAEQLALEAIANGQHAFWLDLSLILSVQGKFTGARQAQTRYLEYFPHCPRVRFGMAPFALHGGELQAGLQLLEAGREISCWGRGDYSHLSAPVWDGSQPIAGKTLLLHSEGGLGDETLGFRAAHWAKEREAKCVVACSKELMPLAATSAASAVVDMAHAGAVHCDYWLPAMSAPRLFERSWATLWPGPYIQKNEALARTWSRLIPKIPGRVNIGLRWRGNPRFEHEQLRCFDPRNLFEATGKIEGIQRWSLQKDEHETLPEDMGDLEPFLSSWQHTVAAMMQLDLVITSCTSIAHVAGALGIPTWVIVPVMPYYYAARPSEHTEWYPSMRIYRQECYGDWAEPFRQVKRDLETLLKGVDA